MSIQLITICVLYLSGNFFLSAEVTSSSLKLVQLVFQNGDSLPHKLYPTDPNPESTYRDQMDQLTNEGKLVMFKLGQFLRTHYANYLNKHYVPRQVHAQSADSDKAISSALMLLAGFFPPDEQEMWSPNITWQPIPVHTVPESDDLLLRPTRACDQYKRQLRKLEYNSTFQSQIKRHQNVTDFMMKMAGVNNTDSFQSFLYLLETLVYQDTHNMKLDPWVNETFGNYSTIEIAHKLYNAFYSTFKSGPFRSLLGGQLLKRIETQWNEMKNGKEIPKMFMYFCHAELFGSIMDILGHGRKERFPPGSGLLMELHEIGDQMNVHFQLIEPRTNNLKVLNFSNCDSMCSLGNFIKLTYPFLTSNMLDCQVNMVKQAMSRSILQKATFTKSDTNTAPSIMVSILSSFLLPLHYVIILSIILFI